ncbi:MAG: hypothetical protein JO263_08940 [Candidatus Eremiobacteraeota bacterium]|nr:hypothetical protein [Candidatus Eremiobacteraeota bacterium]
MRFNLPEGLIYLVGSGRLDGNDLDDEHGNSPLLARNGAHVGEVAAGESRSVEIAFSVAGAIENGTTVELQSALASFELPPIGSNVVRLIARSRPQLRNALSRLAIEPERDPTPGSNARITVVIHNAGESSARDVVAVVPIPDHATYVPGSARVNGRELERELGGPFDRAYAPVIVRMLPPNATATLTFGIRIDAPLEDGVDIVTRVRIASQETPAFELEAASLTIVASADFGDERTHFSIEPSRLVPGRVVRATLTARNSGNAPAQRVTAVLELPEELAIVRGASTLDGRPVRERRKEPLRFALGTIGADEERILSVHAAVVAPLPDATTLTASATLDWEPSRAAATRRLECNAVVDSQPHFAASHNAVKRAGSARARPGSAIEASIVLANDGSAAAHDAILRLRFDRAVEDVTVADPGGTLPLEADTVDLGMLDSGSTRLLTLRARVASPYEDRSEIRIAASLHCREAGEIPLGESLWRVDSHPEFAQESSGFDLADESVLHPNQVATVDVIVTNVGTDSARNVRLRLYVSPEARLESVDGAVRERSSLIFGEIAPGSQGRARLGLRLLRSLAHDHPVTIEGVLTAEAMLPVPLARLTIATSAAPDFSVGRLQSMPDNTVDVGENVEWLLHLRNGGDGPAKSIAIIVTVPDSLIYVPNSTKLNGVTIGDAGNVAPFAAPGGIVLTDVDAGVEATLSWLSVVHNKLASGTRIMQTALLDYDERHDEIFSNELVVRSGPLFASAIGGLPFGVDGVLGPALGGRAALSEERFLELPPATPIEIDENASTPAQLSAEILRDEPAAHRSTGTLVAFTADQLARTLRLMPQARFGGLVTHLFAIRALLPTAIGDGYCASLATLREMLHEELDRLFIKLRLPRYAIAPHDIETPSLRSTIARVLGEAVRARGTPSDIANAAVELRGGFDPNALEELSERVESSPLASATPWVALAQLLPDVPSDGEYRAALTATLAQWSDAESDEFIAALQRSSQPQLDAALDSMLERISTTALP